MTDSKHLRALMFGASGINGWAVVNAILEGYPTPETFSQVTALTNRPLNYEVTLWPKSEKLELIGGVDLLQGTQEHLQAASAAAIPDISIITHVYFNAYIADWDQEKEFKTNTSLLRRGIAAVENLSESLEYVVLTTGLKYYGMHITKEFPFHGILLVETQPRIPEPYASKLFYYSQVDALTELSHSKKWTFCNVMPDLILGFTPTDNYNGIAQVLARYLALVRELEGPGAKILFPGTPDCWKVQSYDSSQDVIAKFAIYASLHAVKSARQNYNIADSIVPSDWSAKWPVICDYFELTGTFSETEEGIKPSAYLNQHDAEWKELESKYNLQRGRFKPGRDSSHLVRGIMRACDRDRPLYLQKAHDIWGVDTVQTDTLSAWGLAFDHFRRAEIIP